MPEPTERKPMPSWMHSAIGIFVGSVVSTVVLDWYRDRREARAARDAREEWEFQQYELEREADG